MTQPELYHLCMTYSCHMLPNNRLLFKGGFIKHLILGSVKKIITRGHVCDLSVGNHVYLQNFLGRGHAGGL